MIVDHVTVVHPDYILCHLTSIYEGCSRRRPCMARTVGIPGGMSAVFGGCSANSRNHAGMVGKSSHLI
jgi:hypothetical protein